MLRLVCKKPTTVCSRFKSPKSGIFKARFSRNAAGLAFKNKNDARRMRNEVQISLLTLSKWEKDLFFKR